jgi:hypothetical protein
LAEVLLDLRGVSADAGFTTWRRRKPRPLITASSAAAA